jgi:hypothetical protein
MSCGLCHRPERGADEKKEYICGSCLIQLIAMNKDQKRQFIDNLYLKGQDEEAQFLESFFRGGVSRPIKDEEKEEEEKPKLLLRRRKI